MNYYNENDSFAENWLSRLMGNEIPRGDVDGRDIRDVTADDLGGYTQCHFFAGIGGWSHALGLAGVSRSVELWTGSCPCQPFSVAGRKKGTNDERHLWPVWRDLIAECRPPIVFGEQVASPLGRAWLSTVRSEMEALGYEVGAADLCAAGVGAPHIRQRLFFGAVRMADAYGARLAGREKQSPWEERQASKRSGNACHGMGITDGPGPFTRSEASQAAGHRGSTDSASWGTYWSDCEWVERNSARRGRIWGPVEPGTFPLAARLPEFVGLLRGYGNSIVPQVAAVFIRSFLDAVMDRP